MTYDRDYFIKKFESIPDEQWYVGNYTNEDRTAFCAYGHCGEYGLTDPFTKEATALQYLLEDAHLINDGLNGYNRLGITPKERILNALRAI